LESDRAWVRRSYAVQRSATPHFAPPC
jgi:hypothetical protein